MNILNNISNNKYSITSKHISYLTLFTQSRTDSLQDTKDFFNSKPNTVGRKKIPFNVPNPSAVMTKTQIGDKKLCKGINTDQLSLIVDQLNLCNQYNGVKRPVALLLTMTFHSLPNKFNDLMNQFKRLILKEVNKSRKTNERNKLSIPNFFFSYVGFKEYDEEKGLHVHMSIVVDKDIVNPRHITEACMQLESNNSDVRTAWVSKQAVKIVCKGCNNCAINHFEKGHIVTRTSVQEHSIRADMTEAVSHLMYIAKNYTKENVTDNGRLNNLTELRRLVNSQSLKQNSK
jgi:hypothetical protein